jgi:2-amino-4-hydroxy-6-hydroxymethyldihydropteridine diphosphokinase
VEVILLLGSNLGDREAHLRSGIAALGRAVRVTAESRFYESAPFGPVGQPWFLNAAVRGECPLDPHALLDAVKAIERAEGRTDDSVRWGPRTLDIDIILMGNLVVDEPDLAIPHASMAQRRFCLLPVSEIAADFRVPPGGETVSELLERCNDSLEVYPR